MPDPIPHLKRTDLQPSRLGLQTPVVRHDGGRITLAYYLDPGSRRVEFSLYPTGCAGHLRDRRSRDVSHPFVNDGGSFAAPGDQMEDSLIHVHLRGDGFEDGFGNGHTQRFCFTTQALQFKEQTCLRNEVFTYVETVLEIPGRIRCRHIAWVPREANGAFIRSSVENISGRPEVLENLTSFVVGKLSPFAVDDMAGRLNVHRIRSAWSAEGKWETRPLEDFHIERSWAGHSISLVKFGQRGSMPVRGFFPFIGLEDRETGVHWAAQTYWHGSWQMELWRRKDPVSLSGGLGDYDFAHWARTLAPGETVTAPLAWVVSVKGDLDELGQAVASQYAYSSHPETESESRLPVIFNEWCSSWGNPSHADILEKAPVLEEAGADIFVIDDGWAEKPGTGFQHNGDWNLERKRFPEGLLSTSQALRKHQLVTGIWFEAEVCTVGTEAFDQTDHLLRRHGRTVRVGPRHFWDFRDPFTRNYLRRKMTRLLIENGIGYLKIDYNDSIGTGCDSENPKDGLGEGLRAHLEAVKTFYEELRSEVPDLVFENCSSGGHRIEPGFVSMASMSSFSDAHETVEIPIIAANLHRLIPPARNQVWAVLRREDDEQRLNWSLAATFLGRMCLSGDIQSLGKEALNRIRRAVRLYRRAVPAIRSGRSRLIRNIGPGYRHPEGWQCVLRETVGADRKQILAVFHAFSNEFPPETTIPLPDSNWVLEDSLFDGALSVGPEELRVRFPSDFSGGVAILSPPA